MQKFVLLVSKKLSWCIWLVDVVDRLDANGKTCYKLDPSYKNIIHYKDYYDLPPSLRNYEFESKFVFDTKLAAQLAADQLIDEQLHKSIEDIEKKAKLLQEEAEKLKNKKPKGRYRGFLLKDKV